MSIGEVLAHLSSDFPDVTISKIRYLEGEGLVEPERTPAGYRKFTRSDVERLRYVLLVQRDHYLPLRVIRQQLDAMDAGAEPPAVPPGRRLVDASTPRPPEGTDPRPSRRELITASGGDEELVASLESFGILTPLPGTGRYDAEAATIVAAAVELGRFGIEPRHLRPFLTAAERQASLVDQVVAPLRRRRGPDAPGRAEEAGREVAAVCLRLHAALVRAALDRSGH